MVEKTLLNNGVRIVTEHLSHIESVSIGILFGCGSRHEEPHEQGITHFIEHMLLKSGDIDSALQMAKKIDALGGPLNAFTGREYSFIHLHTIADKFASAASLIGRLLHDVRFSYDAVEHERQIIEHEIKHLCEDGSAYIHDLFSRTFWRSSSLGNSVTGSLESVLSMDCDRLEQFYTNEYLNACQIISVVGNVRHDAVVAEFESILKDVAVQPQQIKGHAPVSTHRAIRLSHSPDMRAQVCLGFPALNQSDPRRFVAILLDSVWGGGMSSRVFQRIREKHAWAYNLYSYLNSYSDSGAMVTTVETDISHVLEVLDALCDEAQLLTSHGVSFDDLMAARQLLQVRLKMGLDSTHVRMERLAMNEFYREDNTPVEELLHTLECVTPHDVNNLAVDLMRDEQMVVCVLGDIDTDSAALQNIRLNH